MSYPLMKILLVIFISQQVTELHGINLENEVVKYLGGEVVNQPRTARNSSIVKTAQLLGNPSLN